MAAQRKTPNTWIKAGMKALRTTGPAGVQAETLARTLGATKGSFYWHFKDVPAFHDALLETWRADICARFDARLNTATGAVAQLRAVAGFEPGALDHAVRAWAVHARPARRAVQAADRHITGRIADLLGAMDARHRDFPGLVHAALFATPKNSTHGETLVDLLLVLK